MTQPARWRAMMALLMSGLRLALLPAQAAPVQGSVPLTVRVGDGAIDGTRLVPYENAWLMSAHAKDGRVVEQGIWSDLLRLQEVDGRQAYVRTQGMTYRKGLSSFTINTFDPVTLAPISSEVHGPQGNVVTRRFAGAHIETRITPPGGTSESSQADLPAIVFDFNGGMYGLLLATQKLTLGMTGTLPAVAEFTNDYEVISYKVVGRERVRVGASEEIDTWVVETGDPASLRFWVSERAPYIIRLVIPGPQVEIHYDMIRQGR